MKSYQLSGAISLPIIVSLLAGCATGATDRTVTPGDLVGLHFTCRQNTGEIAASTYADVNSSSQPKSTLFVKRDRGDAVVIAARSEQAPSTTEKRRSFEDEIMTRLARAVLGMRPGEGKTLELDAEPLANLPPEDQFIKISRVRKQQKEMKISLARFKVQTKKEPVVDQQYNFDPAMAAKVVSISGDEVLLRFVPRGEEVNFPFGKAVISEKEDHYEIDIKAVKGTLVRTGGLVGRIVDVDADSIKLDYGQPFGGEALICEVKVESVQPGEKKGAGGSDKIDAEGARISNDALAKAAAEKSASAITLAGAKPGDLVTVNYTAALENGEIFSTTSEGAANDPARKKVSWYSQPAVFAPEEIMAGKQELLPGLGEALVGMAPGEKKQVRLGPDKAFGPIDTKKLAQFPCSFTIPRVTRIPADEYVKRFSSFPVLNKEIDFIPYFKSRVTEVTERDVALENLAKDGQTSTDSYGTVAVSVAGDRITTTLKPLIGAQFPGKDGMGIITASDGKTFTVDSNNPLAGKTIVLDLEAVKVTKAALNGKPIDWIDGYVAGLARAKKEGKPVFLLLYADWCGWCKKTFSETIPDPRIIRLKDKFVWVKVNSDKETKYKQQYGQDGFPMMVVLDPDGTVLKKIDGYRDARGLKSELDGVI